MDYLAIIQYSIDSMESDLYSDINMEAIINNTGISKYHFYRLFTAIVGVPPLEYIKRRRLSNAALSLVNSDKRIIEIAFDAGFESQEAFTRTFKLYYSVTPARFRKEKPKIWEYKKCELLNCKVNIKNIKGGSQMEVKIVERGEIKIIGMAENISPSQNSIPALWERFMSRIGEIKNSTGNGCYGVADNMEEAEAGFTFDETVGIEVTSFDFVPEGMITKVIPPQKYIIFTHKGLLFDNNGTSKLHETYDYIYSKWLPESEYMVDSSFNFEFYDDRFIPNSFQSEMDIYIPIK